jgi:hypothetical protein
VVTSASAAALSAAVVLPVLTPGVASSVAALALLGACNGTLDVAMNARPRRPIPLEREHAGGGNFTTNTEGSHG